VTKKLQLHGGKKLQGTRGVALYLTSRLLESLLKGAHGAAASDARHGEGLAFGLHRGGGGGVAGGAAAVARGVHARSAAERGARVAILTLAVHIFHHCFVAVLVLNRRLLLNVIRSLFSRL